MMTQVAYSKTIMQTIIDEDKRGRIKKNRPSQVLKYIGVD